MKKVYLKDIAEDLQLSKATVSLVLNGKGDEIKISQDTQQRIIDYAKLHNYVPNQLARGLSRGKSETIGLIIPDISNAFYAEIASRIEKKAEDEGYTVVFSSSHENVQREQKLIRSMINRQVDGLIIASTQHNQQDMEQLKNDKIPFVLIDRHYPDSTTNCVIVDNYEGVKNATEHLLKLGRKRVAFVTVNLELEIIKQRGLGYVDAVKNFDGVEDALFFKELDPVNYKDQIPETIQKFIETDKVDAIIFATHYLIGPGLQKIKNMGLDIPKDVALISFDDLSAYDWVDPPITSIAQPKKNIGHTAVEVLLKEIKDKTAHNNKSIVLKTQLNIRKSCGS